MEEEWKDIEGFEGYYQVSSEGNVRSLDREIRHWKGGVSIIKGKMMKLTMNSKGYLQVRVCKEGKQKMFKVHRLVYAAFNGEIPEGYEVNHIDECKTNNRLDNLNLLTHKQNMNFGTRNERSAKARSKPVIALDADGNIVFQFPSAAEAERQGFNQGNLSACCRGELKTHRGYRWKYINS